MSGLNPSDRVLRARLGGFARAAKYDGREMTAAARRSFDDRFVDEVDPDRKLPPQERARRAEAAKKAYMTRLALRSAQARRKAAQARVASVQLAAEAAAADAEAAELADGSAA